MNSKLNIFSDENNLKVEDLKSHALKMKLKYLGLQSSKNLIYHMAIENGYNSNLTNDISEISYIENSKGKMCLTPIPGFNEFLDDIYFVGYIFEDEIYYKKGGGIGLLGSEKKKEENKIKDSTNLKPSQHYLNIVKNKCEAFFSYECKQTRIIATPALTENCKNSFISFLLQTMNKKTKGSILKAAKNLKRTKENPTPLPVGIVAVKVHTANIPIDVLIKNIPKVNKSLNEKGFALYQVDYTRDFLGTLERNALYDFYVKSGFFREEDEEAPTFSFLYDDDEKDEENENQYLNYKYDHLNELENYEEKKILDDLNKLEKTAGFNIVKYKKIHSNFLQKVKFYNKPVANFEAGNTQNKLGSHLCEFAYNYNHPYLKRLFSNPEVKKCGCTRLEISLFGMDVNTNYTSLIKNEFDFIKNEKIFHIQPTAQQWINLASNISKSCLIADRTNYELFISFFVSTVTKRASGVYKKLTFQKDDTEEKKLKMWKNAKKEMIKYFSFDGLPCYVAEFEIVKENGEQIIKFEKNKCYTRKGPTFLTPTMFPGKPFTKEKYPDLPDIKTVLPHTENIKFIFRNKQLKNKIGKNTLIGGEQSKPFKIEAAFNISLLSTRKRKERLLETAHRLRDFKWKQERKEIRELEKKEKEERIKLIEKEKEEAKKYILKKERADSRFAEVENDLRIYQTREEIKKIEIELRKEKYTKLYAFKKCSEDCFRILFKYGKEKKKGVFFANGQIKYFLKNEKLINNFFKSIEIKNKTDQKKGCCIFCMPLHFLRVDVSNPSKMVLDGDFFEAYKIKMDMKKINQEIKEFIKKYDELNKKLESQDLPLENFKEWPDKNEITDTDNKKFLKGKYEAYAFSERIFRSKKQTVLYITKQGETEKQIIKGWFLQDKLNEIQDITKVKSPLILEFYDSINHKKKKTTLINLSILIMN